MRGSVIAVLSVWLAVVPGFGCAQSLAVEHSARPEMRPGPKIPIVDVTTAPSNLGFRRWIAGFRTRALRQGIKADVFDRAFDDVRYDTDVIQKDRNQSEFTKQIWEYLDSAVSATRVANGMAALKTNARLLDRIEARYGVDKEVVAAIWGLESAYGTFRGSIPTIGALATLAFDGRRGAFFEEQLIDALKIIQSGDISPKGMKGSWAGAMGHTQFMPSSYLAHAQDFNGDGKRDIWSDNPADALASSAAYLKNFGWTKGHPWGMEVTLPSGFDYTLSGERVKRPVAEWRRLGVLTASGGQIPDHGRSSILLPAGAQGAAFVIFDNFHVIERYNTADAYVIGVGHLADRIAGGPAIRSGWPRGDRVLSFTEKKEMQRRLLATGFDPDGLDGIIGPNTIAAVRAYQSSIGLVPDGYASLEILKRLR